MSRTENADLMGLLQDAAPMREPMEATHGINVRGFGAIADHSTPVSRSCCFAPSVEALEAALA